MQKSHTFRFKFLLVLLACMLLACQAGGMVPSFFATATPTFTITPSPTATATATSTPVPTPTPIPDISLEPQADGSTLFVDNKAGFSLLIPSTWVAVPANVDDVAPYVERVSEDNPQLEKAFSMLQKVDPNVLKIMAMDTNMDHYKDSYVPNFTIIAMQDPIGAKMPLENVVQLSGISLETQFPDASLLDSGVEAVNSEFSYGYNELMMPITVADGTVIKVFQKQAMFSVEDYVVLVTLSAHASKHSNVLTEFDAILKSIQFLD